MPFYLSACREAGHMSMAPGSYEQRVSNAANTEPLCVRGYYAPVQRMPNAQTLAARRHL